MTTKEKPLVERFGPEWWALYAASWQALRPASNSGVSVREKDGWVKTPIPVREYVRIATEEADAGIEAFNEAISE